MMALIHDILWAVGLALMIMSAGYGLKLFQASHKIKIPIYVVLMFIAGIVMYLISFFLPIPIVH